MFGGELVLMDLAQGMVTSKLAFGANLILNVPWPLKWNSINLSDQK